MTSTGHLIIHVLALNTAIKVCKGERVQLKTTGKYGEIFNSHLAPLTHLWTGNYLRLSIWLDKYQLFSYHRCLCQKKEEHLQYAQ